MKKAGLKRILATVLSLIMVISLMAGCGGSKTSGPTQSPSDTSTTAPGNKKETAPTVSGEIKYNFWGDASQLEAINRQIEQFKEQFPNVNVVANASDWGTYWEKLRTESAGGQAPDTFAMSTTAYLPYFAELGFLKDVGHWMLKMTVSILECITLQLSNCVPIMVMS